MKSIYKERFLWTDMLIVIVLDVVIVILVNIFKIDITNYLNEDNMVPLFSSLIGTWGSLLGFVIAALSILLTIKDNEYIKALRSTKHYTAICFIYLDTSIWLGIATLFSIVALIFVKNVIPIVLIGSFLYPVCIFKIGRCLQFLKRIIEMINK